VIAVLSTAIYWNTIGYVGVRDILVMDDPFGRHLIVGAGDGTVEMVSESDPPPPAKTKLKTQKLKIPSQPRLKPVSFSRFLSSFPCSPKTFL